MIGSILFFSFLELRHLYIHNFLSNFSWLFQWYWLLLEFSLLPLEFFKPTEPTVCCFFRKTNLYLTKVFFIFITEWKRLLTGCEVVSQTKNALIKFLPSPPYLSPYAFTIRPLNKTLNNYIGKCQKNLRKRVKKAKNVPVNRRFLGESFFSLFVDFT